MLQKFFRGIWSKKFLRKNLKRNFVENFSEFSKIFGSKSVETFFSKSLKNFSNGRMTLIFSFRHPFSLKVWVSRKIVTLKCVKRKITQKNQHPPLQGGCCFFGIIFSLTHYKVAIFLLIQTMALSGGLKEKINVIRPLKKFLL